MIAIIKSLAAKTAGVALLCASAIGAGQDGSNTNEPALARAERLASEAKERWSAEPKNADLAWQYSRACFEVGELPVKDPVRAEFALKGIEAARQALQLNTNLAAAHYYLGLNLGQFARTKNLGALKLVGEMESSFNAVIRLDASFDYAGAHRCLGLLYRDAPGWPISVGNRGKARQHLTRAVELSPEYPENWFCLIEAHLGWGEKDSARSQLKSAESHLTAAEKQFTGVHWQATWNDWTNRLEAIRKKLQTEKVQSAKSK